MSFERILRDVMEEDNGLILRVTAYERMMEAREPRRGWTARTLAALARRSGKIADWKRARRAIFGRSETCH